MRPNRLREVFARGETAVVGWLAIVHPYSAEQMGHAGYDALVIDLQHSPLDLANAITMLQAISATPAMPMARATSNDFGEINKLLDAGAYGIVCPLVDTADDARRFVAACRYPPLGRRSYGPARGFLYGGADYFEGANTTVLAYGMIETEQGMRNLDAICAVQGLDGVFVGPADLSIALGAAPVARWNDAPLRPALEQILKAARAHGKTAGIFCISQQMSVDMKQLGFDFVIAGVDAGMMRAGAQAQIAAVRSASRSGG
ncbi:MAG: 2,4-dihydroxyhept-2-ene-1,7-dioic acid aldolase [Burkholderiales bacterium]|nr:MAG: 2,4-dihydroxyhept-2-ene-1,7-dioic acid aldolase [Burkholderiales bacterium]